MGIVQKVNMVPMQIAFGLSQGIMPLISYNFARHTVGEHRRQTCARCSHVQPHRQDKKRIQKNVQGVGTSSMMSRALGSKDYGLVRRSSAFGFYCTLIAGVLFSLFFTILHNPLLHLLGADAETSADTRSWCRCWRAGRPLLPVPCKPSPHLRSRELHQTSSFFGKREKTLMSVSGPLCSDRTGRW